MTKQQEALRLADVLIGSPQFTGTPIWQAADLLRRQHEAIVKLREALVLAATQNDFDMLLTGDELRGIRKALKDTEGL